MKATKTTNHRSACPINLTLETLGDGWSLLIVRDLMLMNRKTFNEFLHSKEKIASNILTDRLQRLEAHGIITKQRDTDDTRRIIYRLTKKGIDLAPTLTEIMLWATFYETTDTPPNMIKKMRENREEFITEIRKNWVSS